MHSGACGCFGRLVQCCNGSMSPTYSCNHDNTPIMTLAWNGYDYEKGDFVEIDRETWSGAGMISNSTIIMTVLTIVPMLSPLTALAVP